MAEASTSQRPSDSVAEIVAMLTDALGRLDALRLATPALYVAHALDELADGSEPPLGPRALD